MGKEKFTITYKKVGSETRVYFNGMPTGMHVIKFKPRSKAQIKKDEREYRQYLEQRRNEPQVVYVDSGCGCSREQDYYDSFLEGWCNTAGGNSTTYQDRYSRLANWANRGS